MASDIIVLIDEIFISPTLAGISVPHLKSVKATRVKFAESRRPISRTIRSLDDYRICYTVIHESNWDMLPSQFCKNRNWFQRFQKKKLKDENQFNIFGRAVYDKMVKKRKS